MFGHRTKGVVAAALLVAALGDAAGSASPAAAAPKERVGILIADHGEPPSYNERTYESFRAFFDHLIEMGLIPWWLKAIDTGTIVQDADCYGCPSENDPDLIDAWLRSHDGPAVHVPASDSIAAHYVLPGGPGMGEPDIFEHIGLAANNEWRLMGGRSPNFDQKLIKKKIVLDRLERNFPKVPVRVGYGIDPRLKGESQGFRPALTGLINRERVGHIVVAYHGVGFSDIMQTHMIRHEVEQIVESLDPNVTITYAEPMGVTDSYVEAVADRVVEELDRFDDGDPVAIHLSGHGLPTAMCGEYDCGADAYHASSKALFQRVTGALKGRLDREGKTGVFHLYGESGEGEDDPDDLVDGPIEALAKRKEAGFRYVVDIPYEFDSDSRDTLIVLRRGYERPIPDWDDDFESSFKHDGMHVRITNTQFATTRKADALYEVIVAALKRGPSEPHHH